MNHENGLVYDYKHGYKEWTLNDKRHREKGPAIEYYNGGKGLWYLHGEEVQPQDLVDLWLSRGVPCYYDEEADELRFQSAQGATMSRNLRDLTKDQLVLRLAYLEGKLNEEQTSCYENKFTRLNSYDINVAISIRVNNVEESDCQLIRRRISDHLENEMGCGLLNLTPENRERVSDWRIKSQLFTFETW